MDLFELIQNAQGGGTVQNLGQQFGLNENQTQDALSALLPSLAGAVRQNVNAPGGLESLMGALLKGNHSRYLDDTSAMADAQADGNGILSHLFGDKQVSREVASRASAQTGIDADILKQMLPVVAAMLMGGLSKKATNAGASAASADSGLGGLAGGLGGMLSGLAGGGRQAPQQAGGGILDMLTPLIDKNRDGSAMDDILGMAAGFLRR